MFGLLTVVFPVPRTVPGTQQTLINNYRMDERKTFHVGCDALFVPPADFSLLPFFPDVAPILTLLCVVTVMFSFVCSVHASVNGM